MLLFGWKELGRHIQLITNSEDQNCICLMHELTGSGSSYCTYTQTCILANIDSRGIVNSTDFFLLVPKLSTCSREWEPLSFTCAWYFLGPWLEPFASNTGVWCHIWVSLHRSSKGQVSPSVNSGNNHGWEWLLEKSAEMCHAEPLSDEKDHPSSHWEGWWKQDLSSVSCHLGWRWCPFPGWLHSMTALLGDMKAWTFSPAGFRLPYRVGRDLYWN